MDSTSLENLIARLRHYKPAVAIDSDNDSGEDEDVDENGKVFSSVSVAESLAVAPSTERFRPKCAAVLVCLFEDEAGDLRVILTKRSSNLSSHSGEVSLPGGKMDEGDKDEVETAMREAKEEIGLDSSLVTIVANLEPFLSKHLLKVVPVVGVLRDKHLFKPEINAFEVETIFDAPLELFLKDENHRSEEREWMGEKYLLHYFDYKTENKSFIIWGLTAGILIHAASVVYQKPPSFFEQKPKFRVPRYAKKNLSMR